MIHGALGSWLYNDGLQRPPPLNGQRAYVLDLTTLKEPPWLFYNCIKPTYAGKLSRCQCLHYPLWLHHSVSSIGFQNSNKKSRWTLSKLCLYVTADDIWQQLAALSWLGLWVNTLSLHLQPSGPIHVWKKEKKSVCALSFWSVFMRWYSSKSYHK